MPGVLFGKDAWLPIASEHHEKAFGQVSGAVALFGVAAANPPGRRQRAVMAQHVQALRHKPESMSMSTNGKEDSQSTLAAN